MHDGAAHPVEQARRDAGAVAGPAVHPQLAAGGASRRPSRRPAPARAGRRAGGRRPTRRAGARRRRPAGTSGAPPGNRPSPSAGRSRVSASSRSARGRPRPRCRSGEVTQCGFEHVGESVSSTMSSPQGTSQPAYIANWSEYSRLTEPGRCPSAYAAGARRSITQAPASTASETSSAVARRAGERGAGAPQVEVGRWAKWVGIEPLSETRSVTKRSLSWRDGVEGAAGAETPGAVGGVDVGAGSRLASARTLDHWARASCRVSRGVDQIGAADGTVEQAAAGEQRAGLAGAWASDQGH